MMRLDGFHIFGLIAFFIVGCAHVGEPQKASTPTDPRVRHTTNQVPLIRPLGGTLGSVVSVNGPLRFVVLDFSLNPLPLAGQRFEVVRDGEQRGEVRVTEFYRGTSVAADILSGEVQVGDRVVLK